ncbi:MAG: hypothetical protein F6K37_35105 [Moorea sp. SIO4E2]|uniref:hypothetical protein n=1 Tax=Moorena sp. SIO4E2 TaxID=2607826 RepID=UPI0013BB3FF8|nr:hypothetical protein [Moorena sp. SIO4E2]NEQ10957.1 hypothetical protein [Moorena sp. SIO4E2]
MKLEKTNKQLDLNKQKRDYTIEVVDHQYILNRWKEIEAILYRVFGDSKFNDNFLRTRPAEHTWKNITEPYQEGLVHIIALDLDENILGAFFVIPSYKPEGKEDCDLGWMFTIELYPKFRHEIMSAIIYQVHEVTKNAGFKRIITEMGTEAGAKFLAKKNGYIHTPNTDKFNRWTKELS